MLTLSVCVKERDFSFNRTVLLLSQRKSLKPTLKPLKS